jgi:V8-like Glu-specific endopeptidase
LLCHNFWAFKGKILGLLKDISLAFRQHSRVLVALALTCVLFAACGKPRSSELSIGGGEPLEAAHKSVVRIAFKDQSICAGILVAEDLVLTAAHCLKADDAESYKVVFPAAPGDRSRGVAEFRKVREDSLAFFPNFDVAWIRLVSAAPEIYEPASILGHTSAVEVGKNLTLVGTANDTACHPTDGVCRMVKLSIRLKSIWSSPHLINLAVVDSVGRSDTSGTCPGDSGGPAFIPVNGQELLYGIVAGKDPIFTGGIATACGTPTSVLTRVGEYQDWIEETSGRTLKIVEPSPERLGIEFLNGKMSLFHGESLSQWQDWFTKPLPSDSSWTTVHKILEQTVLEFKEVLKPEEIPLLFQDGGAKWIDQITALKSLTLGFPEQSVAIDDLRPLSALRNLSDLTFLARSYQGLEALERMSRLRSLTIVGRVLLRQDQGVFPWSLLSVPSLETLRLSQLPPAQLATLDWAKLPSLKTLVVTAPLNKIGVSWLKGAGLGGLETLQIQELACDSKEWPTERLPKLKSLSLRSTAGLAQAELSCIRWDLLPGLSEIRIQGYRLEVGSFTANLPKLLADQIREQNL